MSTEPSEQSKAQPAASLVAVAVPPIDSHTLLVVAISPVQSFIGAARRMRDLAYGSALLSDLAAGLASRLHARHHATLIFPTVAGASGGPPHSAPVARSTNKIVCLLPEAAQVPLVVEDLHCELIHQLDAVTLRCLRRLGPQGRLAVDVGAMARQMRGALQLFHAWSRVAGQSGGDYAAAYRCAQVLLDARKQVRNMLAPPSRPGWQLSSLDGARDSVLADGHLPFGPMTHLAGQTPQQPVQAMRRRYQIDAGEQLDAVGLVKRVLGTEAQFPALVRVAMQPWVDQWRHDQLAGGATPQAQRLGKLTEVLNALCPHGLARRNHVAPGQPAAVLPFDADLLLKPRRMLALRQAGGGAAQPEVLGLLHQLGQLLHDEPALTSDEGLSVAILAADGDHMGSEILDQTAEMQPPAQAHRELAACLARFADDAVRQVADHGGCVLYAGGDDLLAVLPVQHALACAESLRTTYANTVGKAVGLQLAPRATLSVGVGIGHVSQPMGLLLQRARQACQAAKDGHDGAGLRNALGLAVQPRAGAQVQLVRPWQADPANPATAVVPWLDRWRQAFADGTVSGSLPYDLQQLVDAEPRAALLAATRRLFHRRGIDRADLLADIEAHWQWHVHDHNRPLPLAARWLADALYLCRWLASHPKPATR